MIGASSKHLHQQRPATPVLGTGSSRLQATIGINTMACRLDELMADKWFSTRQVCRLAGVSVYQRQIILIYFAVRVSGVRFMALA